MAKWIGMVALVASAWIMGASSIAMAEEPAPPTAPTVTLGKGETLWQDPLTKGFKNPAEWNGTQLVIVQTAKQPKGKIGGDVRAIKNGKSTAVAKWQVVADGEHYVLFHFREGKAAVQFGHPMNLKTKDMGSDTFIELVDKKGKVTAGKKWHGDRVAKWPDWVKFISPAT